MLSAARGWNLLDFSGFDISENTLNSFGRKHSLHPPRVIALPLTQQEVINNSFKCIVRASLLRLKLYSRYGYRCSHLHFIWKRILCQVVIGVTRVDAVEQLDRYRSKMRGNLVEVPISETCQNYLEWNWKLKDLTSTRVSIWTSVWYRFSRGPLFIACGYFTFKIARCIIATNAKWHIAAIQEKLLRWYRAISYNYTRKSYALCKHIMKLLSTLQNPKCM